MRDVLINPHNVGKNQVPHNVGLYSLKILQCEELAQDTLVVPHNVGKQLVPHNVGIK